MNRIGSEDERGHPSAPVSLIADALLTALVDADAFTLGTLHGRWLRLRYLEIVPVVLPEALVALETGAPISQRARAAIAHSAIAARDCGIPLSVVLRGGVPALRVFGEQIVRSPRLVARPDLARLMKRAALIAGELGACWVESWVHAKGVVVSAPIGSETLFDGADLDLVPATSDHGIREPSLEMVALAASGATNVEIAHATAYSLQAVKWHLAQVMRAWNVDNRAALVSVAFLRGVLTKRRPPADRLSRRSE